mgnify:CR=1 FL=1
MESVAKLKWRCRRGTKELDFLLESYLDVYYAQAELAEQVLFVELLGFQDNQLIWFLLGEELPDAQGLQALVKKIRTNPNL